MNFIDLPKQAIDVTGHKYGRLTVLGPVGFGNPTGKGKKRRIKWLCECSCGMQKDFFLYNLRNGHTKSCGCLTDESRTKHGMCGTPEYRTWSDMIQRCTNPNDGEYHNYGARGIKICDRWLTAKNFLKDMGEKPEGMQIERIDNDGNYEPGNCCWATPKEQARNRRGVKLIITYRGKTQCLTDWAEELGVHRATLWSRLYRAKWQTEKAFTAPVGAGGIN
jgi:hypothetical protein